MNQQNPNKINENVADSSLVEERRESIRQLADSGDIPYKGRFDCSHTATECLELADETPVTVAGRVVLWRAFGSLIFAHIQDRTGRVQFSLSKKEFDNEVFKSLKKNISLGDFVGLKGRIWTTQKGETTVGATEAVILSKAVRPLPDKWSGVSDAETRQRRRYLDLQSSPETRQRFQLRSQMLREIRTYLDENDFLEVETPILQPAASGAAAKPFETYHESLGQSLYLRIAPETYLKRLVGGSLERVYELGKNFRNEGIDPSHLQEFTMLEWYAAYWDYEDNMTFVKGLFERILDNLLGTRTVKYGDRELNFDGEWPIIDYRQGVLEETGIDLRTTRNVGDLQSEISSRFPEFEIPKNASYGTLVDLLYKKTLRPKLVQPCFLIHHPVELVPLARRSDEDPSRLDMFQVLVNGWEVVKAYSEVIDPLDQLDRLNEQEALRADGDDETMMMEMDFIESMEYGFPPMSGLGFGVDRVLALITNSPTLRDVVLFPSLRAD